MIGGTAITAIFGGDTTQLSAKMSGLRGQAGSLRSAFAQIGLGLSAGVAIGYFRNLAQELDDVAKSARSVGVEMEFLQEMRFAADLTATPVSVLERSLARLGRTASEANSVGGKSAEVFKEFGIEILDTSGKIRSTEALFADVADAMRNTESAADRLRLSNELLRDRNGEMIELLSGGSEGLREFAGAARDAGAVIEKDIIERAERFNDQLTTLATRTKSLGASVLGFFMEIGESIGIAAGALVYGVEAAADSVIAEQRRIGRNKGGTGGLVDSDQVDETADREKEARMKRLQQLQRQIDREARTGLFARIDMEAQRQIIEKEILDLAREQRTIRDDEEAWMENQLALQQKMNELERTEQRIAQAKAQEQARVDREKQQREREITQEIERQKDIRDSMIEGARADLSGDRTARRDAVSASLEDLASGDRGTASQTRQAREIQRLEERAARRADRLGFDDSRTQDDLTRAESMRRNLDPLSSRDREPFKNVEEFTRLTSESVQEINDKIGALSASLSRE